MDEAHHKETRMKDNILENEDLFAEDVTVDAAVAEVEVDEEQAAKLAAFKEKKKAAAKKWKENKVKEAEERVEKAKELIDLLKAKGYYEELDDNTKNFLYNLANPGNVNQGTSSLFTKLFGPSPSVGSSFTLNEAFQKTLKGKSHIDFYIKKWAEKGTIVSFKQDNENILNSVYTLENVGDM